MGYLQDFKAQVESSNYPGLLQLWEEYCNSEMVDGLELRDILTTVKKSDLSGPFGAYVELVIPLWKTIEDGALSYSVLKLILDLQTTNSEELGDIVYALLKEQFSGEKFFGEKMRLIGMRNRDSFQGALTNYELLSHLNKGKFVFHTGGWGTGEILDLSLVREELVLEFENVLGRKDITFQNAFKQLKPLPDTHFLSRRFGNPDALERDARANPVAIIHMLLRDLGPLTAGEIKDELCELVIPEEDWTKWWQSARSKIKRDTKIETPAGIRHPFRLREAELSHEERFKKELEKKEDVPSIIQTTYNFLRDFSEIFKNADLKAYLRERLDHILEEREPSPAQTLQVYIFLESLFEEEQSRRVGRFIRELEDVESVINDIDIIAYKKRALIAVREFCEDWSDIFINLVFTTQQTPLRDYLLKELNKDVTVEALKERLIQLRDDPSSRPETFVWYFQKVISTESAPLKDKANQCRFFEGLLILLNRIEQNPDYRDMVKKILSLLTNKRYAIVRQIMDGAPLATVKEILLLCTKCQSLTDHDIKIFHSLAEVVHPGILDKGQDKEEEDREDEEVIWTTEEGYRKAAERIKHISEFEVVENAKEIEAARALGDLRENSEYKFALEKRARIQLELTTLSDQLSKSRILSPQDISSSQVGVGAVVALEGAQGKQENYTLLGPWEADLDKGILSFRSKFAQAMTGKAPGETFEFQGETFTVQSIESFL